MTDLRPRWVRAGDPLVLHILAAGADRAGWGHALCGESSFSWHLRDEPGGGDAEACAPCLDLAHQR